MLRPYTPTDIPWLVERHRALYAAEYDWDHTFGDLVESIASDFLARNHPRERGWIAHLDSRPQSQPDSQPAGSIFLARHTDDVAKLRLLLVEPTARGCGVGAALVDACITGARDLDYRTLTLWTTSNLAAARRLYERAGFQLTEEHPERMFGADLVSQHWTLAL